MGAEAEGDDVSVGVPVGVGVGSTVLGAAVGLAVGVVGVTVLGAAEGDDDGAPVGDVGTALVGEIVVTHVPHITGQMSLNPSTVVQLSGVNAV